MSNDPEQLPNLHAVWDLSVRPFQDMMQRNLSTASTSGSSEPKTPLSLAPADSLNGGKPRSARSNKSSKESARSSQPKSARKSKMYNVRNVRFRNDKVTPRGLLRESSKSSQNAIVPDTLGKVGWRRVQKNLGKIIQHGRDTGVLVDPNKQFEAPKTELEKQAEKEKLDAEKAEKALEEAKHAEGIRDPNIPVKDISMIHQAIPFLPVPAAIVCLFFNIFAPGVGTILSGVFVLCLGFPRLQIKELRRIASCFINLIVGICQLGTVPMLLIGWFWSIAWGAILTVHSLQYREAMQAKRQAQVATAALEALTNDTLLRRREVHTLVKNEREDGNKRKHIFHFRSHRHAITAVAQKPGKEAAKK